MAGRDVKSRGLGLEMSLYQVLIVLVFASKLKIGGKLRPVERSTRLCVEDLLRKGE